MPSYLSVTQGTAELFFRHSNYGGANTQALPDVTYLGHLGSRFKGCRVLGANPSLKTLSERLIDATRERVFWSNVISVSFLRGNETLAH